MRSLPRIATWSARRPWLAIPLVLVITAGLSTSYLVAEEAEISELFVPNDMKEFRAFETIRDEFGQGEVMILAWETADPLDATVLRSEAATTATILDLPGIQSAVTLTGFLDLSTSDSQLEAQAQGFCQQRPDVCSRLVADDMLLATYTYDPAGRSDELVDATNPIRESAAAELAAAGIDAEVLGGGQPYSEVAFDEAGQGDVQLLLPLALGVMILVLAILFRTISDVVIPLVVVMFSLAWAYATLPLLGVPFNPLLFSVMPLLLGIGIDYQLHIVYAFHEERSDRPTHHRFRRVAKEVGPPVFYTAITTLIGFGSFLFSSVPQVRYWGVLIGVGAFYAFVLGFLLLPALYRLRRASTQTHSSKKLEERLGGAADRLLSHRGRALLGLGALTAIVAGGIALLDVNAAIDVDLDPGHPYIQAADAIEERFGGQVVGYVLVETDSAGGGLRDRDAMIALHEGLAGIEGISFVDGPITRMQTHEGSVPSGSDYTQALAAPYQQGAVATVSSAGGAQWGVVSFGYEFDLEKQIVPELEEILDDEGVPHTLSGQFIIQLKSQGLVLESLLLSTLLAASLVLVVLFVVLRRPRLAATAYAPMLIVVVWQLGLQGYLNIPFNAVTGITTAMVLGIGIDYALHLTNRFRMGLLDGDSRRQAARASIVHVGKPVIAGSLTTVGAFIVLAFSNTSQLNQFGRVAAIVVATAFFVSLIVVPVLSSFGGEWTRSTSVSSVPWLRDEKRVARRRAKAKRRQQAARRRSGYEEAAEFADSLHWDESYRR